MADLEELLIKVNSDLGDLSGIDSAVKALEGLKDFSAKAEKGARSLMGLSAAFVALNREGKNTTGISNLKNQVDSLIGILDKLANHTKNADKSIQQLSALGDALKKFAGVSESLKGLDEITKGVNDMVGVLGALGNLGSASKSIKGVGNIGKDLNNAAKNVSKGSDKLNKELDKVGKVLDKTEKQTSKDMKIDVSVSVADNNKNLNQVINENQKLEGLVKSRHEVLKEYAKVNKQFYETRESLTTADVLSGSKDHALDALEEQANNLWRQIEDLNEKIQELGGKEIRFPAATAFTDIDEKIGTFKSYKKIIADSEAELAKFGKKVAEQNPLQVDDIIQTNKEDTKSVDGFTDAISNISSALDNVDNISKGIANLEKLGEALHSFNGFDENVKSLNSVAMGIRNLIKAVAEAEGLNENSFGFIAHIKNALDTLANNSAGYGNIGSATTGLSKLLEALNSTKTLDLSKLDQVKEKMLELNNNEFKGTAHELSNSLKELNEAFNLLDNAHEGVIGGMGTITQGFTDAASGLYNVREQIEIISQDFDSVLSPVLNSRLIEILETFRSMNDSYKNVSGIAQGLGSLLAVLLKMQELEMKEIDASPVRSLLEQLQALASGGNLLEEVSQKFEKFQGISDAMARLFNAMKYFAIPLDPNQHTVFSYLKGEIEKFNEDVAGKFDETRNLLYGFKGVFEALQKDASVVKDNNLFVVLKKQIEDFASLDVGANLKPIGNFLNGVSQIAKAMQDGKGLDKSSPLFEDLKKQLEDLYNWTSRSGGMLSDFAKLSNLLRSITDLVNTLSKGVTFNADNNIITNIVSAINSFDDGVLNKAESISKTFASLGTMTRAMQKLFWANTGKVSENLAPIRDFVLEVAALKDDLQGIEKPISSLSRLMGSVGEASSKVSIEDNALKAIQFQIEEIAKKAPQMAEAEKAIGNLTKLVDSVAASSKKVGDTNSLTKIADGVKKLDEVQNVEKIGSLANNLTKLVDVMGKNQWDGRKNTAIDKIASGLKKFNEVSDLGKVSSLAKDIKKLIEAVAQNEDKVGKDNVITRLVTSLQGFKDINEQTKGLKGTLSAIEKLIRVVSEDVQFGKNNPLSQLKKILGGFSDINKGTKGLDKVVKSLMQAIEVMKTVNGKEFNIDPVNNPFAVLKEQLEKFVDIIPALENFPKVLKSFKDFIKEFDTSKKFSIDAQPIVNIIGAVSYAKNLGGAVANFKEMISAIGKLMSKGDGSTLEGIGTALGLIKDNIAPFASAGKLQSLVDIANAIVKLKDVDVGKIKEIATAIRDIMSAIGQINGSNNTIKINLDERGIINAEKGFQNAHRSWEEFRNDVLREIQDIDFSHMFDFNDNTPTKVLREDLKKVEQELKNAQKEAEKWQASMQKTENIKTPEGAKDVEAYRRAYQNYWQAYTSASKYKEVVDQLNKALSERNGYELENDAEGYRARKSLTEERKRLVEMLESMSKNVPSLSVFGDEEGKSRALETIYSRIRQIDQDLIGINEELPRVGESIEGIKVQSEQVEEVWNDILKKQREARADISEGFGNFGSLLSGSKNNILGSIGNLSSMFGKAVEKYGGNFSASTIAALTKVAGVLKTLTTALNQVIAIVKVVIAIFKAWWNITGKMIDAIKQFVQKCVDFAKNMLTHVVGAFNAVAGAVKKVASVVQSAAQLIQDALRKIGEFGGKVISVFGKIGHAVAPAVKGIKAVLSAVTPKFIKTLASGNLQLTKIIKNSLLLGGAIKKITQYFSMMSRMLMRKSITAFLNKMKQAFEDMVMFEKNSNDAMLNLNTNVSKVFSELRRAANQWVAAFEPLINAVAPHVVNFLANIQAVGEAVAKFMAQLTGQPYYLRAKRFYEDYGDNVEDTKKKVKDLTNGLDELNILNDSKNTDNSGINPEDMFEKVPVDPFSFEFPEINLDGIIDSIIEWFDSIPWDKIKEKAREMADKLFDILDAVLRRKDFWYKLGEFFAECINTALAFIGRAIERWNPDETEAALSALIQGLVDTIDWEYTNEKVRELAQKIAEFWNAVFKDDELWERIQTVAHELCQDIIDFFRDFAWTFDFSKFADRFTGELEKFLRNFPYKDLTEAVKAWVDGFVTFFNKVAKNKSFWKTLGESVANFIKASIVTALKSLTKADLKEMADSIALAIKTALENIPWKEIKEACKTIANNLVDALVTWLTDEKLLSDITKAIGNIAQIMVDALNALITKVKKKGKQIGKNIAKAIKDGLKEIDWDTVFKLPAEALNAISAIFSGILDEIPSGTEIADWLTSHLIDALDTIDWGLIYDNMMRLAEKLRDFISGILQNGEFWRKVGEATGNVITITLDFLFELVNIKGEDLGTAIKNYINGLINKVNIGKYLKKTVEVAIQLVTAIDVVLKGVNWDKLGDQIAQGIVDAIDTIWKNGGLIQKTIEDAFSVVNNLIRQTLVKMINNNSFYKIGDAIGKVLMGIINGLYEFFILNGDLIIEGMKDLGKSLADYLRAHKAEIIAKLNGIIDTLVDMINTFFDEKGALWKELYDIISNLHLDKLIATLVREFLIKIKNAAYLRDAVWKGVKESGILIEIGKICKDVIWDIVKWFFDKITDIALWVAAIAGIFTGNPFLAIGALLILAIKKLIKQAFSSKELNNDGIWDGVKSWWAERIKGLKDWWNGVQDWWSGIFGGNKKKKIDVPVEVSPSVEITPTDLVDTTKPVQVEDLVDTSKPVELEFEDAKLGKIKTSLIEVTTIKAKKLTLEDIEAQTLKVLDIFADELHVKKIDSNSNTKYRDDEWRGDERRYNAETGTLSNSSEINASKITTPLLEADLITTQLLEAHLIEALEIHTNKIVTALLEAKKIVSELLQVAKIKSDLLEVKKIVASVLEVARIKANTLNLDDIYADDLYLDDIYADKLHIGDIEGGISGGGGGYVPQPNISDNNISGGSGYIPRPTPSPNPYERISGVTLDLSDEVQDAIDDFTKNFNDANNFIKGTSTITIGDPDDYIPRDFNGNPLGDGFVPVGKESWRLGGITGRWSDVSGVPNADELLRDGNKFINGITNPFKDIDPNLFRDTSTPTSDEDYDYGKGKHPQGNSSDEQYIHDRLMEVIGNEEGVAGVMGNLFKESNLRPDNAQDSFNIDDREYVDWANNNLDDFIKDSVGFGLAQWTIEDRKRKFVEMLDGRSVDDIEAQMDYLIWELENDFSGVLDDLRNASSVEEASDIMLHGFEKPKDQSTDMEEARQEASREQYEKYNGKRYDAQNLNKGTKIGQNSSPWLDAQRPDWLTGDVIQAIRDSSLNDAPWLTKNGLRISDSMMPSSTEITNLLGGVDWNSVFKSINWNKLLKSINWNKLLTNVNWNTIGGQIGGSIQKTITPEGNTRVYHEGQKYYGTGDSQLPPFNLPDDLVSRNDITLVHTRLGEVWLEVIEFINKVKDTLALFDFASAFISDADIQKIKNKLKEITDAIKDMFKDISINAEDEWKKVYDIVVKWADKIIAKIKEINEAALHMWDGMVDATDEAWEALSYLVKAWVKEVLESLQEIKDLGLTFKLAIDDLSEAMEAEMYEVYEMADYWLMALANLFASFKPPFNLGIYNKIVKELEKAYQYILEWVKRVKALLEDLLGDIDLNGKLEVFGDINCNCNCDCGKSDDTHLINNTNAKSKNTRAVEILNQTLRELGHNLINIKCECNCCGNCGGCGGGNGGGGGKSTPDNYDDNTHGGGTGIVKRPTPSPSPSDDTSGGSSGGTGRTPSPKPSPNPSGGSSGGGSSKGDPWGYDLYGVKYPLYATVNGVRYRITDDLPDDIKQEIMNGNAIFDADGTPIEGSKFGRLRNSQQWIDVARKRWGDTDSSKNPSGGSSGGGTPSKPNIPSGNTSGSGNISNPIGGTGGGGSPSNPSGGSSGGGGTPNIPSGTTSSVAQDQNGYNYMKGDDIWGVTQQGAMLTGILAELPDGSKWVLSKNVPDYVLEAVADGSAKLSHTDGTPWGEYNPPKGQSDTAEWWRNAAAKELAIRKHNGTSKGGSSSGSAGGTSGGISNPSSTGGSSLSSTGKSTTPSTSKSTTPSTGKSTTPSTSKSTTSSTGGSSSSTGKSTTPSTSKTTTPSTGNTDKNKENSDNKTLTYFDGEKQIPLYATLDGKRFPVTKDLPADIVKRLVNGEGTLDWDGRPLSDFKGIITDNGIRPANEGDIRNVIKKWCTNAPKSSGSTNASSNSGTKVADSVKSGVASGTNKSSSTSSGTASTGSKASTSKSTTSATKATDTKATTPAKTTTPTTTKATTPTTTKTTTPATTKTTTPATTKTATPSKSTTSTATSKTTTPAKSTTSTSTAKKADNVANGKKAISNNDTVTFNVMQNGKTIATVTTSPSGYTFQLAGGKVDTGSSAKTSIGKVGLGIKNGMYQIGQFSVGSIKSANAKEAMDLLDAWQTRFVAKGYQMGGMPQSGEIYVARENGTPEFVGSFGNRTAVANNDQIVTAVANGVSMAQDKVVNAIANQTNAIENAIDRKNLDVQIGDRQIAEANRRGEKGLGKGFVN